MKFEISLFRFDCNSDYLPYYTKHFLKIENDKTLLNVILELQREENFAFDENAYTHIVINNIFVKLDTTMQQIYDNFGSDLQFDPISIKRANNDFIINEEDFNNKIHILNEFIAKDLMHTEIEDYYKSLYNSYKTFYYASKTLDFEKDYIGDAVVLLASHLIDVFPDKKDLILKRLKEQDKSLQYHTKLDSRIFELDANIENKILDIKEKLGFTIVKNIDNFKARRTKTIDFGEYEEAINIIHDFKDFSYVALNVNYEKIPSSIKAKEIKIPSHSDDFAKESYTINQNLSKKITAHFMLEAIDYGADFILVANDEDFYLLDSNRKDFEKIVQRDVNIPVLHLNEFLLLINGKTQEVKKMFEKHSLNPDII